MLGSLYAVTGVEDSECAVRSSFEEPVYPRRAALVVGRKPLKP